MNRTETVLFDVYTSVVLYRIGRVRINLNETPLRNRRPSTNVPMSKSEFSKTNGVQLEVTLSTNDFEIAVLYNRSTLTERDVKTADTVQYISNERRKFIKCAKTFHF